MTKWTELFEFRNGEDLIQDAIGLTPEEFREADQLSDAAMDVSRVHIKRKEEEKIYQSAVDHIVSAENISDRVRVAALMYLGTASSHSPDIYPQIESVREIYDEIAGDFDNVHNFSGSLQRALQHIPEDTPMNEAAKVIFYTVKNGRKLASADTADPLMQLLSMMR